MKWILNKLFNRLSEKYRIVRLTEKTEKRIIAEMSRISGIEDYWELHKQAGYTFYGKTDDKRWLGYVSFADTMLIQMRETKEKVNNPPDEAHPSQSGYESESG